MVNLIQKSKLVAQLKKLGDDTYNEQYVIKDVLKELERVEKSIPKIPDNKPINDEIITLKGKFVALASSLVSMGDRLTNLKGHFETRIDKQGKITKEIEDDFKKVTDEIKKELEKISKTRQIYEVGAGNMNRQINVEGVDVLTKYTDINFYGVSSSVIASVDTANKRVNIGIPAGGGTGSLPATSITFSPTSSIASTNVQAAIEEVDTTRVPNIRTLTIDGTSYDLSADRSWTTSAGGGINRISSVISVSSVLADTALKDFTVFANVGIKLTLPTAVNNLNKYTIKNVSSSSVLTICTGAETIDGSSTALINVANQSLDFLSDNTNWNVI